MSSNLDILISHSSILNKPKTTTPAPAASTPKVEAPASGNTSLFQNATLTEKATGIGQKSTNLFQFERKNDPVEVARNRALEQAQKEKEAFTRLRNRNVQDMEDDPAERRRKGLQLQSYNDKIAAADEVIRKATEGISADWETKKAAEIEAAGGDDLLKQLMILDELESRAIKASANQIDEKRNELTSYEKRYNAMKRELKMLYGDKVDSWLEYVDRIRNRKAEERALAKTVETTKKNGWTKAGMSAASVVTNKLAGFGYVDVLGQKLQRSATGSDAPIDYSSPAQRASKVTNTIRGAVSEDMNGVGSFLYNTGMSMADSLTSMPMGNVGMVMLGGSAATSAMQEAAKRGASDNQALMVGLVAGAAETLLEKASVDSLFNMKQADTAKDVILNVLKQAGAEGTEEGLTTIVNTIADAVIMGDKSEYETAKRAYMAEGMTAEQAELKAFTDWVTNFALDVAGGMLSGGAMAGGKAAVDAVINRNGRTQATPTATPVEATTATPAETPAPTVDSVMPKVQPEQQGKQHSVDAVMPDIGQNKTAPAAEAETESTSVNTNPAAHTPQEQAVIDAYQGSVDEKLVRFAEQVKDGSVDVNKTRYNLNPIPDRAVPKIRQITGIDASGFSTVFEGRMVDHTIKRHGENGAADQSMRDLNDIGRIQYVIDNYDDIKDGGTTKAYTTNKPNGKSGLAKTVVFEKAVNGTYYVVEAVPDTKAKTTYVVSAYMSKNGAEQLTDATNAPVFTAETGFAQTPNLNISNPSENVNGEIVGDMGAKTSDFRHETKESQSKTTPRYYEQNNIPEDGRASGEYTVVHRDESLHNAKARLEQDYAGEVEYLKEKTTWSDEEMLEADLILRNLRDEAEKTGDWSEHRKWAKVFGEHKTEAGRALGVLGMLSEETGDTILESAAISLESAKKGTDADAVMQTVSDLATKFDAAMVDKNVDELVNIIKETANTRKTGFYSGKLGKLTSLHLNWAIKRIANYAKSGATISEAPESVKAFNVGDVVSPSDRGNFGKVTKVNDDGTYEVHFVSKTGHEATKTFAGSELRAPKGKSIVASDISTDPNTAFEFLKNFAAAGIKNVAADTNRASALDMAKSIRRNAMLSKFSTIARNLVGNTGFDIADTVARDISVPLDMLLSTITGTRSVSADYGIVSKAKRQGAMDGLAMALLETSLDVNARDQKSKYEGGSQRTFKMSGNIISKVLSTWEGLMGYGLYVPDEIAKGATGAEVQRGLNKLYEAGKIQAGDESLKSGGTQEALYRTFQDDTAFSKAAVGMRDSTGIVGEAILPFAQVPANLADRAIDYSPAGIVETAKRLGDVIVKAKKGTLTAAEQAAAVQNLGRNITGSVLIALAFAMAAKGIVRVENPGGEDENKDKAASEKSQGLNGTQWNVSAMLRSIAGDDATWRDDDNLVSIAFAEPFNAHLTIGALLAEDAEAEDGLTFKEVAKDSFTGSLAAILDMPLFESAKNVFDAYRYSDKEREGEKVLDAAVTLGAEAAGSFIPNAWKGIAQGLDEYQRDLYSKDTALGQLGDQVLGVFNRDALPIKQDPYGNDMKNPGGVLNFLNANILPGAITKYTETDLINALNKLSEETGKSSMYLSKDAPKSITVNDEKIELTDKQKETFMTVRGDAYEAASGAIENNAYFRNFSNELKLKVYGYAEDYATQVSKDALNVNFDVSDWIAELKGKSPAAVAEIMVQKAVESMAQKTGENKYDGLGDMLESNTIDDQLALACMSDSANTAYGQFCKSAGVSVQQFLDVYGTAYSAGENNAEKRSAALDAVQKMGIPTEQKTALAQAMSSVFMEYIPKTPEVPDQWLLDNGDTDTIVAQMGKEQREGYDQYIADSSVNMQTYLDFYNFAKGAKNTDGNSRQEQIIAYLEKLDVSDEVKGRLFCSEYKRSSCPLTWRTHVPKD